MSPNESKIPVARNEPGTPTKAAQADQPPAPPIGSETAGKDAEAARRRLHTGRNEPCPCGSGKKYKKCCLPKDEVLAHQAALARQTQIAQNAEPVSASDQPTAAPEPDEKTEPDADGLSLFDTHTEPVPELPPEVDQELKRIWDEFEALEHPTTAQMNALLDKLLSLPLQATEWYEVFHTFARLHHQDLPGAFRRIAGCVPHTKATGLGCFYWAVVEEFDCREFRHLLPEVVAGLRKFDLDSYDPDALRHIEFYLLADGFDAELLEMAEHFLPIMRQDETLMPHAVPELSQLVFEIRSGRLLLGGLGPDSSLQDIARQLRAGIEEEIFPEAAACFAAIAAEQAPATQCTRTDFNLLPADAEQDEHLRQASLRLNGNLLRVVQEMHRSEGFPPGCAFPSLGMLLDSAYEAANRPKKKKSTANLLDSLRPAGLEERIAWSCRDLIGVNVPKARLLFQAHRFLLHFAVRHQLLSSTDAAHTESELARLESLLAFQPDSDQDQATG